MNELVIPHKQPLRECRLLARYDRFIADVEFDNGEVVRSHCINPGRMEGLVVPGARAWVSPAPEGSKRKLLWTLELIELDCGIVGANTVVPNRIAEALVRARLIPGMKRWRSLETEVRYGKNSRIDLMLRGATDHLVEVKNCHLVYPDRRAYFPDSVSERASKHLRELMAEVEAGRRASVLFVLQRTDADSLRPSQLHDPVFYDTARAAANAGVRFRAAQLAPAPDGYRFLRMIPVNLGDYSTSNLQDYRSALDAHSGWRRRTIRKG